MELTGSEAMSDGAAEQMQALDEALAIAKAKGWSVAQFADRVGAAASGPPMWRKRGRVPAEYPPAIERETGVRCERLRPDIAWSVLREQAHPTATENAEAAHA